MTTKLVKFAITVSVLALVAFCAALFLIDPNNYKDLIQQKAKQTTGIHIEIEGDIAWSLYPIGFDLNGLSIFDQNGALFTRVESMQLALDTMSLISLKPEIQGVYASGSKIVLKRDRDGSNNWDNLVSKHSAAPTESSLTINDNKASAAKADQDDTTLLFIPAQHIHVQDLTIQFEDALNEQDILISELDLEVSGAKLAKVFPLSLSYQFASDALSLSFGHELETQIELSADLQHLRLIDLINNIDANGAFGRNRAVKLSLTGDIEASLENQEIVAHNIQLSGAGLAVDTNFKLSNNGNYPYVVGNLSVAPFSLASISKHLSLDLGINDNAFRSVKFQSPFELKNNKLTLPTFDLGIDNSQFLGRLTYHTINQSLDLNIKGDNIDVDNYLAAIESNHQAPLAQQQSRTVLGAITSPDTGSVNRAHKQAILPLEVLQKIDAEITITQDTLRYSDVVMNNIRLNARLKDEKIALDQFDAQIFEGQLNSKGGILLTSAPSWKFSGTVSSLNLEPVIAAAVADLPLSAEGQLNAAFILEAKGNTVSELLLQNKGELNFDISNGALNNLNLDRYLCEGIALVNQDKLSSDWDKSTTFSSLTSKNTLLNGVLDTNSINIQTPSLQAYGAGSAALNSTRFSYSLAVKPLGLPSDNACIVNPKFSNLEIPLRCDGNFNSETAGSACQLDKQRLTKLMEQLAKDEASRKIEKELDRGFDKKIGEYIDKDSELGKQLKKGILSIFN